MVNETAARRHRLTLTRIFAASVIGLVALLATLYVLMLSASRQSLGRLSDAVLRDARGRVERRVRAFLGTADEALADFERRVAHGAVDARDPSSLERDFFATMLAQRNLAEITLTWAKSRGHGDDGSLDLAPEGRGQLSVFRSGAGEGGLTTRLVEAHGDEFAARIRSRGADDSLARVPLAADPAAAGDPTRHLTFTTTTSLGSYGEKLRTDLHYTQLDDGLPEARRRVVVSVLKAIEHPAGEFLGVVRVSLLTASLGGAVRTAAREGDEDSPHRVFLCDERGRLVTSPTGIGRLAVTPTDELRLVDGARDEAVLAVLDELRRSADGSVPLQIDAGGERYRVALQPLAGSQGWMVGVVFPESRYLAPARRLWLRLMWVSAAVMAVILAGGVLTVRTLRRSLGRIAARTRAMERFEFAPEEPDSPIEDVSQVLQGLEHAKTAMRAMERYVPIDLVRQVYRESREPALGGELREITLMFTDIAGFTTIAEKVEPAELAAALGRYLEVMADTIHAHGGAIDKYIGDAVMAMWNAPDLLSDHAHAACAAALACRKRLDDLFASREWHGRPPFPTRFGLHTGEVLVGHFGAPDRMNYTALGDGVNLASRLEGLNKEYGTTILVSDALAGRAADSFEFRQVDVVAVKGKTIAQPVHELVRRQSFSS